MVGIAHLATQQLKFLAGIFFVLENPTGSFLFMHPAVERAMELCRCIKITVHLLGFHGESFKPLWLAGTAPWLWKLARESRNRLSRVPRTSATTLANVSGSQINGDTEKMRASQQYPVAFSACVARLHKDYLKSLGAWDVSVVYGSRTDAFQMCLFEMGWLWPTQPLVWV